MQPSSPEATLANSPLSNPWIWLSAIVLLSAFYYVVDDVIGWESIFQEWKTVPALSLVSAYILFIASHIIRAARIYLLLKGDRTELSLKRHFPAVLKSSSFHQFLNNLLPLRLGELSLPALLKHNFNLSWGKGISKLVWLRVFDALVMGMVCAIILAVIFARNIYTGLAIAFVLLVVVMLAMGIARLRGLSMHSFFYTFLNAAPSSIKEGTYLSALTATSWFFKLSALSIITMALGNIDFITAISAIVAVEFSTLLPINGIAGTGSFEAAFALGASLLTNLSETIIAIAINLHAFVFLSTASIAVFSLVIRRPDVLQNPQPIETRPCGSK